MDEERAVNFTYRVEGEDLCFLGDGSQSYAKLDGAYLHGGEDEDHGLNLIHPNYLHTRFLNVQADNSGQIGLSERIFDFFDQTLEEYVNSLKYRIHTEIYSTVIVEREAFRIINPNIKEIIRSMISFVRYIHSEGLTFRGSLQYHTHFGVLEGVLKFWRVSFSRSTRHVDRRRDFKQIVGVIRGHVLHGIGEEQLPDCLGNLLRLMASDFPEHWFTTEHFEHNVTNFTLPVENFFQVHISLMSSEERMKFIMNCHNKVDGLYELSHAHFRSAVLHMGNNTGWVTRLENSLGVLYTSIFYGILKARDERTSLQEAIEIVGDLSIDDYLVRVRQRYYDANPDIFRVNRDIITVCRNVATHSYEVLKCLKKHYKDAEAEVDAAIMMTFGDLLTLLQEELFKRKLLPYFMR